MLKVPRDRIGSHVDLGLIEVTPERVRRYAEVAGDHVLAAGPCDVAPLGFALALRGKPLPEVDTAGDTVSVHAGHAITLCRPLTAPGTYRLRARIADVFEKSGRSGPLAVIQRRAEICALDGSMVATVDDQQIVRRHRGATGTRTTAAVRRGASSTDIHRLDDDAVGEALDLEVGAQLPAQRRLAPSAEAIALYAHSLGGQEPLFLDRDFAASLGYADVIVPGPLQSALLESMLRRQLPGWGLRQLTLSFRVSVVACQPITLTAIVVERHLRHSGTSLLCDLAIENDDGERTALGTAALDAA
jgi:acyl dehydratase